MKKNLVTLLCLIVTTSSLSLPPALVTDAPGTIPYAPTEALVDSTTAEATSGQETSDNSSKNAVDSIPGVQIETDILLLIPETVAEEAPLNHLAALPGNRARSLDDPEDYDAQEKHAVSDNDDLVSAEALVFRPLFRYRKHNTMRRRVDRNDGRHRKSGQHRNDDNQKRFPFHYCPPCRFYYF